MNAEQFIFWLHGFFDLEQPEKLSKNQTTVLKKKLDEVFKISFPNKKEINILNKKDHNRVIDENKDISQKVIPKRFPSVINNKRRKPKLVC